MVGRAGDNPPIGKSPMTARKKKKPDELMASFGRRGGNAVLKKNGKGYYSKLAKQRWAKEKGKDV